MSSIPTQPPEALWTVNDVARILRTSPNAVYKLAAKKRIPQIRFGRKILFRPDEIRGWLDDHTIPLSG